MGRAGVLLAATRPLSDTAGIGSDQIVDVQVVPSTPQRAPPDPRRVEKPAGKLSSRVEKPTYRTLPATFL
jgi:hypothetical protein